jgi:hypothetical protein
MAHAVIAGGKAMKISAVGAGVGALIGCVARAAVVFVNLGPVEGPLTSIALPSAGIGLLTGAIAGAFGRPLLGAAVGAVLSGVVFELFMFACSSVIGSFSAKAGADFLSQTLIYGLEMAIAGAIAGGVGGLLGQAADTPSGPASRNLPPLPEGGGTQQSSGVPGESSQEDSQLSELVRRRKGTGSDKP